MPLAVSSSSLLTSGTCNQFQMLDANCRCCQQMVVLSSVSLKLGCVCLEMKPEPREGRAPPVCAAQDFFFFFPTDHKHKAGGQKQQTLH